MTQSRAHSLLEAAAGTAIGFAINLAAQLVVLPWFGFRGALAVNLEIGAVFTAISVVRTYLLRRAFNALRAAAGTPR